MILIAGGGGGGGGRKDVKSEFPVLIDRYISILFHIQTLLSGPKEDLFCS